MYKIEYTHKALKELLKLPSHVQKQITNKLAVLAKKPFDNSQVKALKGEDAGFRLRVGDYRVVYYIENNCLVITVVKVGHRKDIYQ